MTTTENFSKEIFITEAANGRLYATVTLPMPIREDDLEPYEPALTREAFRAMNDHLATSIREIKHLVDPIIRLGDTFNDAGEVTHVNFAEYREDTE